MKHEAERRLIPSVTNEPIASPDERLAQVINHSREFLESQGLEPLPTNFRLVSKEEIFTIGGYLIPGAFHHWTRGAGYYRDMTEQRYNVARMYEIVVNTNPAIALLQETNDMATNFLVIPHVLGHTDFFNKNAAFTKIDRSYPETAHVKAERIEQHEFKHGLDEVEKVLDAGLSLQFCIEDDPDRSRWESAKAFRSRDQEIFKSKQTSNKYVSDYDDLFELTDQPKKQLESGPIPFPLQEEGNLLRFISLHSTVLEDWQRDVLQIVDSEAAYFKPQIATKIMNEGWATFWHTQALHDLADKGVLTDEEEMEWPRLHSAVVSADPRRINPYHFGYTMWQDINRRFNGEPLLGNQKEYDWDGKLVDPEKQKGRMEYDPVWIREHLPSDQSFIRNYLTPELVDRMNLYSYEFNGYDWRISDRDAKGVMINLVNSLTNGGRPVIRISPGGADKNGNGELYLEHKYDGKGLDIDSAKKMLQNIHSLWGRTVYLNASKHVEETNEDYDGMFFGPPYFGRRPGEKKQKQVLLVCKDGKEVTSHETE
jgi:stage V sporulation protein R